MKKHRHSKCTLASICSPPLYLIRPNFLKIKQIIKHCVPFNVVLTVRIRTNIDFTFDRNQYLSYRFTR